MFKAKSSSLFFFFDSHFAWEMILKLSDKETSLFHAIQPRAPSWAGEINAQKSMLLKYVLK